MKKLTSLGILFAALTLMSPVVDGAFIELAFDEAVFEPLLFPLIVSSEHRPIDKEIIVEADNSFELLQKLGHKQKFV